MNKSINTTNSTTSYNPWENKAIFIQDTGKIEDFLFFIEKIEDCDVIERDENNEKEDSDLEIIKLNQFSSKYFERLNEIEVLYEKYKYEYILSKNKQEKMLEQLNDLIQLFKQIELNKVKIGNLLLNSHFSENNTIKIKHSHKSKFIKILKIMITYLKDGNELDFIQRSFNLHSQTIDKLKNKFEDIYKSSSELLLKYNDVEKYNLK